MVRDEGGRGGPPSGLGRPTSRDVARLAGVSHTAVSFVFNDRADGNLSPATQESAWDSGHLVLTVDSGGDQAKEDAAVAELLDRRVDGIIYATMSLRRVRVPEGLHRTRSVLANCVPEDEALPAVIPA